MSDDVITVRLPRGHAAFLQASLALLATTTRQAMTRPGLKAERHMTLRSRVLLLESIDDAVRGAMLEVPQSTRRSRRGVEMAARQAA
ncbi:MAG TPA: hypothetical protein VGM32_16925 [Rhodopila sp.]